MSTKIRCLRVSDELWESATAKASEEGVPLSEVIRRQLAAWVARPKYTAPEWDESP